MNPIVLSIVYGVVLLIFIALSFFFSSSDMVYGSVDTYLLEDNLNKNPKKKSAIYSTKLSRNYDQTISTILLLNDTVNAGLDSITTLLGVNLCYIILGTNIPDITAEMWGFVASLVCLVIKIIFGEIVAKSIGKIYNFKLSLAYSRVINALTYVFYPITFFVAGFGKGVSFPITHNIKDVGINEEDLHEMVDDIEAQGSVDDKQANLLHDAIIYTHTEAYEIMTPRVDMFAIDIDDEIENYINDPRLYKFTRIPVYQETIDNIIGYVNSRNLILLYLNKKEVNLKELLLKPLRFPRSIEINDILKIFKKEKQHFALIMDEYGGVEGLITMEDILEEIVGDIWDENDDKNDSYSIRKDGSYIVDGKLNLEDFCDLFNINHDDIETEYVTIGGFCVELLDDKFAKLNDVIHFKNLTMRVIAIDKNNAIEKLHVKIDDEIKE